MTHIRASSARLGHLLNDLLDFNTLEAGQSDLKSEPFALGDLVRETAAAFEPEAVAKALTLTVRIAPTADDHVLGDPGRVRQILTNLISNAFKFSAKRSDARIEVGATMINGTPEFYVKDNGAGFNQKYAGKLFTLFQRMHSESEFAGTGVGLAVVKRLIEHHGGRISAESVPGEQTVFRFTLAPDLAAIAAA